MRVKIPVFLIVCLSAAVLVTSQKPVNDQPLPTPYATPHARNGPRVIERPEDAQLQLPDGFQIGVWAEGFERPRFMLLGPSHEVLLSDSADEGAVYALRDTDGDGKAESRHKLLDGMYRPYGLAFWNDYLYVAGTVQVKRWKYDRAAMKVQGEGEEIVSWPEFRRGHWTRSIVFHPSQDEMFLSIGSASNVDAGEDPRRAAINVYNPDGTGHRIFASGLRNVIGLDFYPGTEQLWAAVQERDALGDDLVPDYFTTVNEGEFFGWPYAYIGPNEDPRRAGEAPELVKKTRYPDVLLGSHVAVLDIEFYTADAFPEKYHGGAFLAYHGSWNRSERVGYSVAFVPFRDGKPISGPEDFLTGWMLAPDKKEVWGRPVGILQLPDGSLLVSEDGGNKVWRIHYAGS
ncbi:MAG TPA: PQQ-dependent sugar dehydrogenase [Acidobacteriota bacterium]|nr:PQQ-dependent sugar dehydrogenase [Acidobacteriota bacterium]